MCALFSSGSYADNSPFIMGALGDSITTAVNANGWGASVEESWATGASSSGAVNSHYRRLKEHLGTEIQRYNVAQGGATSASLEQQVNQLLKVTPDYVTVLIGANDVCSWQGGYEEKIAAYLSKTRKALQRIITANSQVKIYLAPVPNLLRVWEVGRQHSCQWFWDLTNVCAGVFHSSRTPADRQDFMARVTRMNAGLQTLADDHPDTIKFASSLVDLPISWTHLSPHDCFHPSLAGQNLIAEKTWESGWYNP
jgi:lysophospholipase L1-like esterase